MISVFFWVAFGAVIGWVAAILQDETATRRVLVFVAAGAVGGLLGGFGGLLIDPSVTPYRSDTTDIMFAVFGATAAVFIAGLTAERHSSE
jgi:uncharacterized membrane protein YeaQ/YmgE (transglycosylase-associated protein family)